MDRITVVGLGIGTWQQLTLEAAAQLEGAERLLLRTERHPVAAALREKGIRFSTLDALYAEADSFEELAGRVADRLQTLLAEGPVTYAVPGQGFLEDDTVGEVLRRGLVERVIPGLTALDAQTARAADRLTALCAGDWRVLPASRVGEAALDAHQPTVITSLDDSIQAGNVKLALAQIYGDEAECVLITGGQVRQMPLYQLDHGHSLDHTSLLAVSRREGSAPLDYQDLIAIIRRLRAPGGCPWDREQTHASLRGELIEESYEVADAIDREDWDALANELGDVLLQVVMQGEIGGEEEEFDHLTITDEVCRKMIYRHPHVFGNARADTTQQVQENWDALKRTEKKLESPAQELEDVARALPALLRGRKILKRAGKWGLPLPEDAEGALRRFRTAGEGARREALGDTLLAMLAAVMDCGEEPEDALQRALDRYIQKVKEKD